MYIVDSHCHLDLLDYKKKHVNLDEVISQAMDNNVKFMLSIATSLSNYQIVKKFIKGHKNVGLACGVHPLNKQLSYTIEELYSSMTEKEVLAIGETGLDYTKQETKKEQKELFRNHIRIAIELNKPIIVHMRNAFNDTIEILRSEHIENSSCIIHCFTENTEAAKKLLNLGCYISFSGIVTFRNHAEHIREAARYVPLNRMLIETDSPYLSPVPHRGKENQPSFVRYVCNYIATLKGINVELFSAMTTKNFSDLFHSTINNCVI